MFKNKKATIAGRKVLFYIIFAIIATITVMVLIEIIITDISEINRIPPRLEEYVIINRFLHSPECFAYKDDDIGRVYPLIDWKRFTDGNLRYCYNADSGSVKGFKLSLTIENGKEERGPISTANWEGFLRKKITKDVLVLKENDIYNGELTIAIQNENG